MAFLCKTNITAWLFVVFFIYFRIDIYPTLSVIGDSIKHSFNSTLIVFTTETVKSYTNCAAQSCACNYCKEMIELA